MTILISWLPGNMNVFELVELKTPERTREVKFHISIVLYIVMSITCV